MSIQKSIKTRLLSAAYKAACALSDYRDKLAEELREGQELVEVLAAHNNKVQGELDSVHREIYGPDFPTGTWAGYTEREQVPEGAGVRDFDDLPAPQGVNEDEAPEGYKAVPTSGGCTGCAFDPLSDACPAPACYSEHRGDGQEVIFVKR